MHEQTASQEILPSQSLNIEINNDYTLNEVLSLHQAQETSLQRTPHTGNINMSHILHFQLGLPAVLYDRNKGRLDSTFNPHMVVNQNGAERISNDDVLMTHARIESSHIPVDDHADLFELGGKVADAHTEAIRRVFPEVDVVQYSDYLAENNELVSDVLHVVSQHYDGELWQRWVEPDGNTKSIMPESNTDAAQQVFGVSDDEKGWIIANKMNVLLMAVAEAKKFATDRVYHISGPDMYRYIDGMADELDYLYATVRDKLPQYQLPQTLDFVILPMANIKFIANEQKQDKLEELIDIWPEYLGMQKSRKDFFKALNSQNLGREDVSVAVSDFKQERELPVLKQIQSLCSACPELFYDTKQKNHLSQYDLLNGYGRDLVVPKKLLDMKIGDINNMYETYKKIATIKLK